MIENWKDMQGYEGLYQISDLGRIKSYPKVVKCKKSNERVIKSRILKQYSTSNHYLFVMLTKDKKHTNFRVHRLVAENFIPNPLGKSEVNHINGDKTDNRVENLEWVTKNENMQHAYENGLLKYCKKVVCIETGITYNSIKEASEKTKVNNNDICQCCKGKYKTAGGYHWKYKDIA